MHVPVLAATATEWLALRGGGRYVDCTAGAGGHAILLAQGAGPRGHLLAIDRDEAAVRLARDALEPYPWARVVHGNYAELETIVADEGLDRIDGILIDAGMSSMQLDDPQRGFTFQAEGPLDMRMDTTEGDSAAAYLDRIDEKQLAESLRTYGDVRGPRQIAKAICAQRAAGNLNTTKDLADAVLAVFGDGAAGEKKKRSVPLTDRKTPRTGPRADAIRQVFQAIRIAVNDELQSLERGLRAAAKTLAPGGRVALITFQSGEDRVWKSVMRDIGRAHDELSPDGRVCGKRPATMRSLTKRPVFPSEAEIQANPRAHSARLRVAERVTERVEGSAP